MTLPAVIAHPVRLLPLAFLLLIAIGTCLLMLPFAHSGEGRGDFMPALFTSVSAATVTGLATVDTATYWTPAGQGIMLALVQIGGLGIMTLATMLGLLVGGRLGLRTRLIAQAEMHVISLGEVRPLLRRVALTMLFFEGVIAVILTIRFRILYFDDLPTAIWHGLFHSVMAFNNAGLALNSDSLVAYAGDAWLIFPICIEGGIMPRSGGFNSVNYGDVREETLGIGTIMMFIGGGSASTAGGIKITTFLLLAYVIFAELRGDPEVMIGKRSVSSATIRTALTIALLAVMLVATTTMLILTMTDFSTEDVLFECASAFGTVGLSTGITPKLPHNAQGVLMVLMFIGRVGTITAASALTIARTRAPKSVCGKTLLESGLRAKHGVTVVGIKRRGEDFTYARPETFVDDSFELIVSGPTAKVEAFCALTNG